MTGTDRKNHTAPGVFVTEASFPSSIPGVETAVPAFIGYTAKAAVDGKPRCFTPVLVNSLMEFQAAFGAAFTTTYDILEVSQADRRAFTAERWDATAQIFTPKFYALARTKESGVFNLYSSLRLFYANGGNRCYVVSVGDYTDGGRMPDGVAIDADTLTQGLTAIGALTGPTMLVISDAVLLKPDAAPSHGLPVSAAFNALAQAMLAQCGALQDRVAILDVYGADALDRNAPKNGTFDSDLTYLTKNFRDGVGKSFLDYGMAYFPFLVTSVVGPDELDYRSFNLGNADQLSLLQGILTDDAAQLYPDTSQTNRDPANNRNPQYVTIKNLIAAIPATKEGGAVAELNRNLAAAVPLLRQMGSAIAAAINLLPPSSAMAGIYAFTDSTRGVWNAPANVTLDSVFSSNVPISDRQQGDFNLPIDGKAINVIRDFAGRGPVVWGARTLDGNSNDWRYISVRRTLIYVRQSIQAGLNPFIFEPNDANTWVAATAMTANFLQNLWRQGGLMGARPVDAFNVQCGLGRTMTAQDILDGYMIVQVTLAMIRPAEFIILTLRQKMERGA